MKKILLLPIIFFLTGCMKYHDLNELAIIKSIGISYDNEYILYAEIIDQISQDNIPKMQVIETKAHHINDLFENIKKQISKEIYFSHLDLLVLDFNIKDQEYQELINFFIQHPEFRNDFLCILSSDIKNILEHEEYDEIEDLIKTDKKEKKVIAITFEEIMEKYLNHQSFSLSEITYQNNLAFQGNYKYYHNNYERIHDETKD